MVLPGNRDWWSSRHGLLLRPLLPASPFRGFPSRLPSLFVLTAAPQGSWAAGQGRAAVHGATLRPCRLPITSPPPPHMHMHVCMCMHMSPPSPTITLQEAEIPANLVADDPRPAGWDPKRLWSYYPLGRSHCRGKSSIGAQNLARNTHIACTLHLCIACALHVHCCMCMACARHVHGMCTTCARHVHGMCTACARYMHGM